MSSSQWYGVGYFVVYLYTLPTSIQYWVFQMSELSNVIWNNLLILQFTTWINSIDPFCSGIKLWSPVILSYIIMSTMWCTADCDISDLEIEMEMSVASYWYSVMSWCWLLQWWQSESTKYTIKAANPSFNFVFYLNLSVHCLLLQLTAYGIENNDHSLPITGD